DPPSAPATAGAAGALPRAPAHRPPAPGAGPGDGAADDGGVAGAREVAGRRRRAPGVLGPERAGAALLPRLRPPHRRGRVVEPPHAPLRDAAVSGSPFPLEGKGVGMGGSPGLAAKAVRCANRGLA